MKNHLEAGPAGSLPIRAQRVMTGTGEVLTTRTVDCPRRGRIPAETCASCAESRGESALGRHQVVRCSKAGPLVVDLGYGTTLAEVMTENVVCVRADVAVEAIAALLRDHEIEAVPVVDEQGRPIGIVSKTDLFREMQLASSGGSALTEEESERLGAGFHVEPLGALTAGDVMTRQVLWLPPEAPIASAAAIMASERVHRAVVLADDRRIVGIVSSLDLLGWLARLAGYAV